MGIRALCAAAAVMVAGVGAADAATVVKEYNLHLRYEGTAFYDAFYSQYDSEGNYEETIHLGDVAVGEAPSWMKSYDFPDLTPGSIIGFIATIIFDDEVTFDEGGFALSGSAPVCRIGTVSCIGMNYNQLSESGVDLNIKPEGNMWLSFNPAVGGDFEFGRWMYEMPKPHRAVENGITYIYYSEMQLSNFTVVSAADIAPVPLPASAALLPLGIGALAFLRKRRRSAA